MATIILRESDDVGVAAFITDIKSVFSFVRQVDDKLYVTDDLYVRPYNKDGTSTPSFDIGNSNGVIVTLKCQYTSTTFRYKIIRSQSGDVAVIAANGNSGINDENKHFKFAIARVKKSGSDDSYGIFTNSTSFTNNDINSGNAILICDDTVQVGEATQVSADSFSASPTYTNFIYGKNTSTKLTLLVPAFGMHTAFTAKYLQIMLLTPHAYNGDCIINNKNYYCISLLALLDETE